MSDAIDVVLFLYLSTPVTKPTDNYARTENSTSTRRQAREEKKYRERSEEKNNERRDSRRRRRRRGRRKVLYVPITYDSFHALTGNR
jgi:hypothetical protein